MEGYSTIAFNIKLGIDQRADDGGQWESVTNNLTLQHIHKKFLPLCLISLTWSQSWWPVTNPGLIYFRRGHQVHFRTVFQNGSSPTEAKLFSKHLVFRQHFVRSRCCHPIGFQLQRLPFPSTDKHTGGGKDNPRRSISSDLQDLCPASDQQTGTGGSRIQRTIRLFQRTKCLQ